MIRITILLKGLLVLNTYLFNSVHFQKTSSAFDQINRRPSSVDPYKVITGLSEMNEQPSKLNIQYNGSFADTDGALTKPKKNKSRKKKYDDTLGKQRESN